MNDSKLPPLPHCGVGALTSGEESILRAWAEDYARAAIAAQRQPLAEEMMRQALSECGDDYTKRGIFVSGWIGAERANGIVAIPTPQQSPITKE